MARNLGVSRNYAAHLIEMGKVPAEHALDVVLRMEQLGAASATRPSFYRAGSWAPPSLSWKNSIVFCCWK